MLDIVGNYLKLKYARSVPPDREASLGESSTHQVMNLMVTDDQGKDHLQNVEEVHDTKLFDELFFHDKHMASRPTEEDEVTAGENVYGTDSKEGDVAHVQIVVNGKRESLDTPEQLGTVQSFPTFRGKDTPYQISKLIDLGQLAITPTLSELKGYLEKSTYADTSFVPCEAYNGQLPPCTEVLGSPSTALRSRDTNSTTSA